MTTKDNALRMAIDVEMLAKEHGMKVKTGIVGAEHFVFMFDLEKLEAFAKAYKAAISDAVTLPDGWRETDDGKWDGVLRALWRRLQGRHPSAEFWNKAEIPDDEMYIFRAHFATALLAAPKLPSVDINAMVSAFLSWKLPAKFNPDGGISFNKLPHLHDTHQWPVGTNLFTAGQAKAMVIHMLQASPTCEKEKG
jgi:hypothetical protein